MRCGDLMVTGMVGAGVEWPNSTLVSKMCERQTNQDASRVFGPEVVRLMLLLMLIRHNWNSVLDTILMNLFNI